MKLDLHQRPPLTDEERRAFKKLESSFPLIKEQTPKILQEETLEDINLKPTLSPPKSWHLSLHFLFLRWRKSSSRAMMMKNEY